MIRTRDYWYGPILAAVLITLGCVTNDLAPQSFNERLAAGIATVSAIRSTTATLLRQGKIDVADAENVQAQADNARAGLALARELQEKDHRAGDARLTATITALSALQAYLNARSAR